MYPSPNSQSDRVAAHLHRFLELEALVLSACELRLIDADPDEPFVSVAELLVTAHAEGDRFSAAKLEAAVNFGLVFAEAGSASTERLASLVDLAERYASQVFARPLEVVRD